MPKKNVSSKPGKARAVREQHRTEVKVERKVGEAVVGEEKIVRGVEEVPASAPAPASKKTRQGKAAKQPAVDVDEELSQLVEAIPTDDVTGIIKANATCSFLLLFETRP